jgi:hypothetical protein
MFEKVIVDCADGTGTITVRVIVARGAVATKAQSRRSRHSFDQCFAFASDYERNPNVKDPKALAGKLYNTGEQDEEIAEFLASRPADGA